MGVEVDDEGLDKQVDVGHDLGVQIELETVGEPSVVLTKHDIYLKAENLLVANFKSFLKIKSYFDMAWSFRFPSRKSYLKNGLSGVKLYFDESAPPGDVVTEKHLEPKKNQVSTVGT